MFEHRFTIATAAATFLLLLVGGTVNPTGSSLACPEPTLICHGQLFPKMTGGVLYEHGHRLVATTVGLMQIVLTVLLWLRRPSLRWLGVLALAAVCVQGTLGALTVYYKLPWAVSTAHLLLAMAYFAALLYIAYRTRPDPAGRRRPDLRRARPWIAVAAAAVLLQVLLGGLMRHHGGALASVDWPLHQGSVWPADAPLPLQLHMAHRIGGVLVGLIVLAASIALFRAARGWPRMRALAALAPALVVLQITLGLLTIASYRSVPVAVAHFGGAALLWALWWSAWILSRPAAPAPAVGRPELEPRLAGAAQ